MDSTTSSPQPSSSPNQSNATVAILELAFWLHAQKQSRDKKEYKQLKLSLGWNNEDKLYLKVYEVFNQFAIAQLSDIESYTLFSIAKDIKKYKDGLLEEMKSLGKVTQDKLRDLLSKYRKPRTNSSSKKSSTQLAPSIKVVVVNKDSKWNGASGVIKEQHENGDWSVLLDDSDAPGSVATFKPEQLQVRVDRPQDIEKQFTQEEVEKMIDAAVTQKLSEMAEENIAKYQQIQEKALRDSSDEIKAYRAVADEMVAKKEELFNRVVALEKQLASVHHLVQENELLKQQIKDLRSALVEVATPNGSVNFSKEAAKVLDANLTKAVKRLQKDLKEKEAELSLLKEQQPDADNSKIEEVLVELSAVAQQKRWKGWDSRRCGYRSRNGTFFTGIDAIAAFVRDLAASGTSGQGFAFS